MKKILLLFYMLACFVNSSFSQNRGYEKILETGSGIGLDKYTKFSLEFSMINGYRFNDYFYVGIGAGIKYTEVVSINLSTDMVCYDVFNEMWLYPVYARIKVNSGKYYMSFISPFISIDCGYTIDFSKNEVYQYDGLMCEPSLGLDFKIPDKKLMYFMVGVNIQQRKYNNYHLSYHPTNISASIEEKKMFTNTLNLKVGYKF